MKLDFCVACGSRDNLHHHHYIPRVCDGSDDDDNLVTLCVKCHGMLHGVDWDYNHSDLVRRGMAAARAKGKDFTPRKALQKGRETQRKSADEYATDVWPIIADIKNTGIETFAGIAAELARRNVATPKGGKWHAMQVYKITRRIEDLLEC